MYVYSAQLAQILREIITEIYRPSNDDVPVTFNSVLLHGDFSLLRKYELAFDDWQRALPERLKVVGYDIYAAVDKVPDYIERQRNCLHVRYVYFTLDLNQLL